MTDYYKECRHCDTTPEERYGSTENNGHKFTCPFYQVKSPQDKPTTTFNSLQKLGVGYD